MIVDDHPLFCEALSMTLRSALGVAEVVTAASLADGLDRLQRSPAPSIIALRASPGVAKAAAPSAMRPAERVVAESMAGP